MPTWLWILIVVVAALVVVGVIASALRARRTSTLRERFGPEYDAWPRTRPTKREAESELREREKRRDELDIRPLQQSDRDRFQARWQQVQAAFVDDPAGAVGDADLLIQERDAHARLSRRRLRHPRSGSRRSTTRRWSSIDRAAHGIAVAHERGNAGDRGVARHAVQHLPRPVRRARRDA